MDSVHTLVFEIMMLVCFGISWPFNIAKSWKSKTARGKSLIFELCIVAGYCFGIAGKLVSGNITYVLIFYVVDVAMVCIDILLTLRNMALDHMADRRMEKERLEREKQLRMQPAEERAEAGKELAE